MQSLPPELWLLIASNLSQSDLAYLSLASSQLLHIIRPHLYRSVNLEANPYTSHTLALLARDKELARCVIELMLSRRSGFGLAANVVPYQEPSLVNVAALENLITLKRITLLGRIFCTTVEQSQFGRTLANIPLEEFTCIASAKDGPWPSDQLEGIRDLKKFVWQKDDRAFQVSRLHRTHTSIRLFLFSAYGFIQYNQLQTLTSDLYSCRPVGPNVGHTISLTRNSPYPLLP